jgi:hypothetical protein
MEFADKAREMYRHAELFFSGEMELGLDVFDNVLQVPLIARRSNLAPDEVLTRLGLTRNNRPLVLIAFGGEGLRGRLPDVGPLTDRYQFIATPPLVKPERSIHFVDQGLFDEAGIAYNDLVRAVDAAILKPGYSTIAECAANQTAAVVVPRAGFAEAPVLEKWAYDNLPSVELSRNDFFAGSWGNALDKLVAKRPWDFSHLRVNGAEIIARELLKRTA